MDQREKADLLRRLHHGPEILVFPNAWDAVSARIVEAEGYPAVATSSAGCAAVLGYADGQRIPRREMMLLVRIVARAVSVPVTADVEAGYGDPARTATALIAAGAVGMNLEDFAGGELFPLETQAGNIRQVREAGEQSGVPVVINARTDIFLAKHGGESTRFERTVERLNAYLDAGADCAFAPGVTDAETIGRLVAAVKGPLNILAVAGSPSIPELKRLGVRRVSLGSGTSRVAMGAFRKFARELRETGDLEALAKDAISYAEVQQILTRS